MDRDDVIIAVTRLETVATRFEAIVSRVEDVDVRVRSLEESRRRTRTAWRRARTFGGWAAGVVGSLIVGVALFFLIGKGRP